MKAPRCVHCGSTAVFWALTKAGKHMLVNIGTVAGAAVVITNVDRMSRYSVETLNRADAKTDPRPRYQPHAATCTARPRK